MQGMVLGGRAPTREMARTGRIALYLYCSHRSLLEVTC